MPYRPPGDQERKALFAWLVQISSLTAWERLLHAHLRLVDVVTLQAPSDETHCWSQLFVSNHAALETAVARLRNGDRSCFAFGGTAGHFCQAVRHIQDSDPAFARVPQVRKAMNDCSAALRGISAVLEPRYSDLPAPLRRVDDLYGGAGDALFNRLVLRTTLANVPVIEPAILVRTRRPLLASGIWEPVRVRRAAHDSYEVEGCMNYLHAGTAAPSLAWPEGGSRQQGHPTTWRLLWADERYGTNGVPSEERNYVFQESHHAALLRFPAQANRARCAPTAN